MELPGSTYLYTLAGISVSFVGFSALVIVLRQTFGGTMSRLEILITRIFIQLGFIVAASAMLPNLLWLFSLSHPPIGASRARLPPPRHCCSRRPTRHADGRLQVCKRPPPFGSMYLYCCSRQRY